MRIICYAHSTRQIAESSIMITIEKIIFPENLLFEVQSEVYRPVEEIQLRNGDVVYNQTQIHPRRRFRLSFNTVIKKQYHELLNFFERTKNKERVFLFKNLVDYTSSPKFDFEFTSGGDQLLAVGDGKSKVFQLLKNYGNDVEAYSKKIMFPIRGSIKINRENNPLIEGIDYFVEYDSGKISFEKAPEKGVRISAGYEYYLPVRWRSDTLNVVANGDGTLFVSDMDIEEVRIG